MTDSRHYQPALPAALYRAADVRELDRRAIEDHDIAGITLMERAGAAVYAAICDNFSATGHMTVLCGGGNNGGDGFVIARLAQEAGWIVRLCLHSDPDRLKGDARTAWDRAVDAGVEAGELVPGELAASNVVVDAMLGTGLDREVGGELAEWIAAVNAAEVPVVAVDIPSGLHADSGRIMGCAVEAVLTVSFIGLKVGLLTGEGRACTGLLQFDDLEVPATVYEHLRPAARRIDYAGVCGWLQPRRPTAHKGHFGHVLIVGGDSGYAGAARMAGEAAARMGAGLVSLATQPGHAAVIAQQRPELMVHGVSDPADLAPLLERATVVAIGPGLGQQEWGTRLLGAVLDTSLPLVVDADALNLLAGEPIARDNWILTPHPGEAARLLDTTTADIQSDRLAAVQALGKRYGGTTVLKGSGTLIGSASVVPALCTDGNPGMASGGMGDVLSGVLAGLLAQREALGFDRQQVAELGVCLHAAAADSAAGMGERGLLATDLLPALHRLVNPD